MKAAICLCTYEKNECLPNTLVGLAKQKMDFPTQTIILDDCSPEDPHPIVREYLPKSLFVSLTQRSGGRLTRTKFFDYLHDDVDRLLFLSADIAMLQTHVVDALCRGLEPGVFTMGQVKDHYVLPTAHENHEFFCEQMKDMWHLLPGGPKIYSGADRPDGRWFLFMGAILKEDALRVGMHDTGCCDAVIDRRMRDAGLQPRYVDVLGIHQSHPWVQHPCASLEKCEYAQEFRCRDRGITQG